MKKTMLTQTYQENGLNYHYENDKTMRVQYSGLLERSGAQEVYLHYGCGNKWSNPTTVRMNRTNYGFEAEIPVSNVKEHLNVCFKDNANNWDNNMGWNYKIDTDK